MSDFFWNMYGGGNPSPAPKQESPAEREKRAVKVLAGMKVHNSHVKRVQVGEDMIDVPKVEYVNLLEGQIRELRTNLRDAQSQLSKLTRSHNKLLSEIHDLKQELTRKVNLR